MTLQELLTVIAVPDHSRHMSPEELLNKKVVFNTSSRNNLVLLSVYMNEDVINIDIGDEDE